MASVKDEGNKSADNNSNVQEQKKESSAKPQELPKLLEFETSNTSTKYVYVGRRPYNQLSRSHLTHRAGRGSRNPQQAQGEQSASNVEAPVGYESDGYIYFNITNGPTGSFADVYQVFKALKEQPVVVEKKESEVIADVAAPAAAPVAVAAEVKSPVASVTQVIVESVAVPAVEVAAPATVPASAVAAPVSPKQESVSQPQEKPKQKVSKHRHRHHHHHHVNQSQLQLQQQQQQHQHQLLQPQYSQQFYPKDYSAYTGQFVQQPAPRHQHQSRLLDPYSNDFLKNQTYGAPVAAPPAVYPANNYPAYGYPQYNQYAAPQQSYGADYQRLYRHNGTVNNVSDLTRKDNKGKKREHRKKDYLLSSKATTAAVATAAVAAVNGDNVTVEVVQQNPVQNGTTPVVAQLEKKVSELQVSSN